MQMLSTVTGTGCNGKTEGYFAQHWSIGKGFPAGPEEQIGISQSDGERKPLGKVFNAF